MDQKTCSEIFKRLKKQNPNPTTELVYNSDFELLVAVVLSAQATDISVNKATIELFKIANTPEKIFKLGETKLKTYIKTIGLFNSKASNIIKTCKLMIDKFDSIVPQTREELESLPGVGRKTANVILNTAFGHNTIAVDTHVFRVANRLKLANGKTPEKVEQQLIKIIPDKYIYDAHHWMILHGRYTCTARKPKCEDCILFDLCDFGQKNT
jgi:endonuclease III